MMETGLKLLHIATLLALPALLAACDEEIPTAAAPAVAPPQVVRMDGKSVKDDPALAAEMERVYQSCWLVHDGATAGITTCLAPKGYALVPGHLAEATLAFYRSNPRPVPKS